ncbi:MAG: biotin carboxylase N-terminal domain-containing protein, partial [Nocardioides sp.]
MFQRIAVVNRGEAAMRLIHAVRDLNAQSPAAQSPAAQSPDAQSPDAQSPVGSTDPAAPIQVIALYTEAEKSAMFVREADISYSLGPAINRPYLDHAVLEKALLATRADAVWVGWGFVAEDASFVDLCTRLGITFIGPSAEAMRKLGDKIGSKLIAEEVGVPVAPWSRGGVDTLGQALSAADRI